MASQVTCECGCTDHPELLDRVSDAEIRDGIDVVD
jgi:hypothetical protein